MSASVCISIELFEIDENMSFIDTSRYLEKSTCCSRSRDLIHFSHICPLCFF